MSDYLDFDNPTGLRIRGTVIVVPGRGESSDTYRRFGARIAADSYRVRVLDGPVSADSAATALEQLSTALDDALSGLDAEPVRPLVLVGADVSAAALAALVSQATSAAAWWPDGVVLAALPGYGTHDLGDGWEAELDARTHCPVHRGVLTDDASVHRGRLTDAVADGLLDLVYGSTADVAQLLLIGDADPLADHEALARAAKALPAARLSVVRDAHHDVLNDLQHRSVAAEVVSFLEALRSGPPLRPLVSVESSAW
jgi:alpha-beta hydrolase superfamily lysophospholipase